jgi:hypothetical protein
VRTHVGRAPGGRSADDHRRKEAVRPFERRISDAVYRHLIGDNYR